MKLRTIRPIASFCLGLILAWTCFPDGPALAVPYPSVPRLKEFFDEITRAQHFTLPPGNTTLNDVEEQIPNAEPREISTALPSIFSALSSTNEEVRWCGISALTFIARRPDGSDLLREYAGRIAELWDAADRKLQAAPAAIFGSTNLEEHPAVTAMLVRFVKRADRSPEAQSSALYVLAKNQPAAPVTIQTVSEFLARDLDPATRINTI